MALDPLRDLPPRYDVKGGSPRSPPGGIPVREVQEYTPVVNESGVFKMLAGAAGGLWIMAMLAWWTAFQGRGITRDELRNEMKEYKDSISRDISGTNGAVGELKGKQEKILSDLSHVEFKLETDERDFTEFRAETKQNNKLVADWMEAQKVKK